MIGQLEPVILLCWTSPTRVISSVGVADHSAITAQSKRLPGFWLRFAETCVSFEGLLSFVNDFGLLSAPRRQWIKRGYERPEEILETASADTRHRGLARHW